MSSTPLPQWAAPSLAFFAYTALVALLPRTAASRRVGALTASLAGFAIAGVGSVAPRVPILHDWLLPPALLLLGYWTSGRLFVAPSAAQERFLLGIDNRVGVLTVARRVPAALAALLEIAYTGVYPMVPLAFVAYLTWAQAPDPDAFWTVVLVTDYICFAALPWIQTRPPRAIEGTAPWQSPFRRMNVNLLGATSIQVNTFPSGHAAEALVAALLVSEAPWPVVLSMFVAALAVSAGAVLGRYHYTADIVAGWLVALVIARHGS